MESDSRTGPDYPGPVRFLSDLHLGHDMCTIGRAAELWPLIDGAGTLVLNGDTIENRAACFRAKSQDLFGELTALCQRAGARMVLLNGNHDPDCWPHDCLDLEDGSLFVTHGHVLLRLISPWSLKLRQCRAELERIHREYPDTVDLATRFTITRRCCLAMPPSETRQKSRSLAARAGLFLREMWPPTRPLEVLKVWARLPAVASQFLNTYRPEAKVMLFGHTHRAACWRRNGRLLVNTGGFVTFARPLIATLHNHQLTVSDIGFSNGEYRTGRIMAEEPLPRVEAAA